METGTYVAHVNYFKKFYDLCFKEQAAEYGLQMIDVHVLLFLKNNPGMNTARDIVANRGLSKSNVSNALEKLRGRGMLRLEEDPGSRRIQRIFLNPSGDSVAAALKKAQSRCFEELLRGFSGEERRTLSLYFRRINENVAAAVKNREQERRKP